MPYQQGDEKKYFSSVIALMVLIAIAVFALVFSLLKTDPEDIPVETFKMDGSVSEIHLDPSSSAGPSTAPIVPFPSYPPPAN